MAALAMTPKLLDHISNEKYQEKDKWKIDDIALGPANELLISGHNLDIPTTFISMYKEASEMYDNRPEFNRSFRQPQLGEQFVLFLEDNSKIGLKVESALRMVSIKDMSISKMLNWERSPTCVCFYRGELYAASRSSNIVNVCNLDSEEKRDIVLSEMSDCVLDMVVAMEKIYVCTKVAGRALVFSVTGSKEMEFKNASESDAMAKSICIHKRTELVFVLWNNIQIQIYFQKTSQCLHAFDMTEDLHKIRVTTKNILVTLSASECIVSVYDVGEVIKFGELKKPILSSVKEKQQNKLMSNDEENLECHPAHIETLTSISSTWKSASKHSKVEKLRDMKLNDIKQLKKNEKLQRKSDRDIQKLNEKIQKLERMKTELESQQKTLKDNLDEEKRKLIERIKELESTRTELESQQKTLKDNLDEEKRKLNEKIKELESTRTKLESQQKKLIDDLDEEKRKVSRDERTRVQLNEKIQKLERMKSKLESQQKILKDNLDEEKGILNKRIQELESTRKELESQQKKLKDDLDEEKRKVSRDERTRVQLNEKIKKLERMKTELESQQKTLKDNLDEEKRKLIERIKDLDRTRTELESQQKTLKDNLDEEKRKIYDATLELTNQKNDVTKELKKEQSIWTKKEKDCLQIGEELDTAISQKMDLAKTVTKTEELYQIKDAKEKHIQQLRMRLKKTQTEMENAKTQVIILQNKKEELEKSLSREQGRAKELKILLLNLNERIKEQEGIRRDLVSQQQKVKDTLVQEKTHQNERIKELEGIRRDLESRQNKLKETLVQEKGKVTREERSRVQLNERMKELEGKIMALESQQKNLEESLFTEKRKVSREERSRVQLNERIKELELTRAELEYQQKQLKQNLVIEKGKVTREERSRVQMRRRRSMENMNMSAAKIQNDEPGFTTDPATDHENISYLSGHTSDTDTVNGDSGEEEVFDEQSSLEVCSRVSVEGATLQIADTGVSLSIPPGALSEEQTILMKIIPQPCDAQAALKFECNSVVVVELLPNYCRFQCPVSLTLPHCLQLKEEYERNSIDVLISHHDEGFKPKWELLHDARFNLCEENCTISLKSFCWVTYEIHNTIVEAKRIKLYTAGKKMRLNDRIAEVEVGFYPDLPGSGKILELNKDMHLSQRKPYVFLKAGEEPLLINLHKVVPKQWNNSQPDENPKVIPFDSVSISEERSCPFVLERSGDDIDIPLCIFKVGQKGRNEVELTIRPDVLTA